MNVGNSAVAGWAWPSTLRLILPLETKMRVVAPRVKLSVAVIRNMLLVQADQLAAVDPSTLGGTGGVMGGHAGILSHIRRHYRCGMFQKLKQEATMNPKTLLFVGLVILSGSSMVQAQSYYTDSYGNTTGPGVNLYSDPFGNTTGRVGNQNFNTYSDPFGNTTGRVGNQNFNTYSDPYGNTTGTIGGNRLNLNTDPFGNTTGTIGGGRVNCYTDPYGNTTCY